MRAELCAAILLGALLPAAPVGAVNLKSAWVFNTEAFECDGQLHIIEWTNPHPTDVYIRKLGVWMGASREAIGDYGAMVTRKSDGSILGGIGWDHYAEPTGLHQEQFDYGHDWFTLATQDSLILYYYCFNYTSQLKHGHVIVTAFWSEVSP